MGLAPIPPVQAEVYRRVIAAARERGIPFAVGGAFGFGTYTGAWRNTKDLDLYILPRDREAMISVLTEAGLADYYDRLAYDRRWIYRSFADDTIVDAIWAMANQRTQVDEAWLTRGHELELDGERVRALPAEELLWAKLYVVQRDRCDWPDVLNLIGATGATLDWEHLLARIGSDVPVLRGVLSLFHWIAPGSRENCPNGFGPASASTPLKERALRSIRAA
jgi:hypothetical protein